MKYTKTKSILGIVISIILFFSITVIAQPTEELEAPTHVQEQPAQPPQIPNIFLNNVTSVEGQALIHIDARAGIPSGTFNISIAAGCTPPNYPGGNVHVEINMNDSSIFYFESTTVEALSSTGYVTPTAYIMGRCRVQSEQFKIIKGCHYWITLANNNNGKNKTPDIVGFLVLDGAGHRIAYGTGPVVEGDIFVAKTTN